MITAKYIAEERKSLRQETSLQRPLDSNFSRPLNIFFQMNWIVQRAARQMGLVARLCATMQFIGSMTHYSKVAIN
jgi:hypothetical protein